MSPETKARLTKVSTEDLLQEATRRDDFVEAVDALGGKAILFEAGASEWHLAIPAPNPQPVSRPTR